MKRKLGPVAFILETTRAYQRVRNTISSLCLEGTEGRSRFACTRLKEWSNPWSEFKCYPQEICWMYLDESKDPDDDTEVSVGYPWNATSRHPRYPFQRMKWSTFVIQYRIFYEFHDLIDGPRPTCEYPVNE